MKTAQEILEEIRARKGEAVQSGTDTINSSASATNGQPPTQEEQAEELASAQGTPQESVPVPVTDKGQQDSSPGTPAPPGHEGSRIGEEPGLHGEEIGGPSPSPVRDRGTYRKKPAPHRETTGGPSTAHRESTEEESAAHRGATRSEPGGDPAATAPTTDPLSAPAVDREAIAEEEPEPAEVDADDGVSPYYDPVLWQRLEDLALLVADLQDRTTTNSEVVDQLAEEVEDLRGNLLAQDEDPDEIARRLDAIEDTLIEIEGERGLVEANESEQATRGFPWWALALAAGGLFVAALAANRNPPAAPQEDTSGAGAPDIAVPVAAIPEPPVPVAAPGRELPPAVQRLMKRGYRPDEVIWRAD